MLPRRPAHATRHAGPAAPLQRWLPALSPLVAALMAVWPLESLAQRAARPVAPPRDAVPVPAAIVEPHQLTGLCHLVARGCQNVRLDALVIWPGVGDLLLQRPHPRDGGPSKDAGNAFARDLLALFAGLLANELISIYI